VRTCIMNVRHSFRITLGKFSYNLFRLCKRSPGKLYGFPLSDAHKNNVVHNSNWTPRNAHAHMRTTQGPHDILLVKFKVVGSARCNGFFPRRESRVLRELRESEISESIFSYRRLSNLL
jgi:hypothetical protein